MIQSVIVDEGARHFVLGGQYVVHLDTVVVDVSPAHTFRRWMIVPEQIEFRIRNVVIREYLCSDAAELALENLVARKGIANPSLIW